MLTFCYRLRMWICTAQRVVRYRHCPQRTTHTKSRAYWLDVSRVAERRNTWCIGSHICTKRPRGNHGTTSTDAKILSTNSTQHTATNFLTNTRHPKRSEIDFKMGPTTTSGDGKRRHQQRRANTSHRDGSRNSNHRHENTELNALNVYYPDNIAGRSIYLGVGDF